VTTKGSTNTAEKQNKKEEEEKEEEKRERALEAQPREKDT
jgi:hypothetical protein